MVVWMSRIGWCSMVAGIVLCTPLTELLPVDLWVQLKQLFSGTRTGSAHLYLRVTPGPQSSVDPVKLVGAALIVLGLLLLGTGYWMSSKR